MSNILKKTDDEIKNDFYRLSSREDVARILEIDDKSLRYFLYVKKPENMYNTFEIPKKKGGIREINSPSEELKAIQKKLAYILELVYKIKPAAYGFIKDKNIVDNASNHSRRKVILNIDLKDFFSQIHFGRVRGMLMNKPYGIGTEAATVISQIACYNGVLPQGAPSSPIITNMICSPLDTQLTKLAKKYDLVYTRYADDITFSTHLSKIREDIITGEVGNLEVGKELNKILEKNSFTVNPQKIFLNTSKVRQEVTGLVVNKFPNIKREYIRNLRAILNNCYEKSIYEEAKIYVKKGFCKNKDIISNIDNEEYEEKVITWFKSVLKGKIGFIKQIRGKEDYVFLKYAKQLNYLFKEKIFDIEIVNEFYSKIAYNVVVLQGKINLTQGSGFYVKDIGLITSYHVTEDGDFYDVKTYKDEKLKVISNDEGVIALDKRIDYAIYEFGNSKLEGLEIERTINIQVGDKVTIIGYPDYYDGDTPYVVTCKVTSITTYLEAPLYTVSARIVHGASGGVVINESNKVIGIIKAGVVSMKDEQEVGKHGFIPIDLVLEDSKKQMEIVSQEVN